jgi:hypothetical protein
MRRNLRHLAPKWVSWDVMCTSLDTSWDVIWGKGGQKGPFLYTLRWCSRPLIWGVSGLRGLNTLFWTISIQIRYIVVHNTPHNIYVHLLPTSLPSPARARARVRREYYNWSIYRGLGRGTPPHIGHIPAIGLWTTPPPVQRGEGSGERRDTQGDRHPLFPPIPHDTQYTTR